MSTDLGWKHTGQQRPDFAVDPGPGEESVWDYPRPPRIEPEGREVQVSLDSLIVASSRRAVRVLETASPPTVYLPPRDVHTEYLMPVAASSWCEWKGAARYYDLFIGGRRCECAAWSYPDPRPGFDSIAGWFSFYPSRVVCTLGGERVQPQPGGFYGGWMTEEIVGPVKGEQGSEGW